MVAGDTTYVRGGTYVEGECRFSKTATQALPIKILAYPGETPVKQCTANNIIGFYAWRTVNPPSSIGWITVSGFDITGCATGVNILNGHDFTITNNRIRNNRNSGIIGVGTRILIHKNIIEAVGVGNTTGAPHGIYANGKAYTITENIIITSKGYGIQQNGSSSSSYNPAEHSSPDHAGADNWIIANNLLAYNGTLDTSGGAGNVIWGNLTKNTRVENNIYYENCQVCPTTSFQLDFQGGGGSSGITIRNNLAYATGSGALNFIDTIPAEGGVWTQSGNVVNTGNPQFVDGGSNAVPASPDWRLLSTSAAIGMARVNEFPRNASRTVGPFDTVGTPTAVIAGNKMTLTFPMSNAVPIQGLLSLAGVSISCTGSACPGSPTVNTVGRPVGTDSQVEITIAGIAGDACAAANQTWKVSYNSAVGTWTGNDNIGPYPGLHQKIFSFTDLTATNQCTGSGPPAGPGTPTHSYNLNEGTGTTATNAGSAGAGGNGTLTNSPTWGAGKTGTGMVTASGTTQHLAIPYGNAVNLDSQDLTIAYGVLVPVGGESVSRGDFGTSVGTNQRFAVESRSSQWRLSVQSSNANSGSSDRSVTSGHNHICVTNNASTNTVQLYVNGVAGTGSAVKTHSGYSLASNFKLGLYDINTAPGGTYDDVLIYNSLEDCAAIYAAFQGSAPSTPGTLAQAAIQFEGVHLLAGLPEARGALNAAKTVVLGGATAVNIQVHCQNVADCALTAFKLAYRKNGASTKIQVPNTETSDGIWMYGQSTDEGLNAGTTTTRLTGSCAVTNGSTQLTADQVPSVDLPQDGCVMLRYFVRISETLTPGDYFDLSLLTGSGLPLSSYAAEARINVIAPQASAGP